MNLGNRIAIIGNAGGGKSTLARRLSEVLGIPVTHVDAIQFQSGWKRTPEETCNQILNEITRNERWIIDGFGSDDVIERRLEMADTVLFFDYPIWRHYWWAIKRQFAARHGQRQELPDNCPEFTWSYTRELFSVMWRVHKEYTPWFRKLVSRESSKGNFIVLNSPNGLKILHQQLDSIATK